MEDLLTSEAYIVDLKHDIELVMCLTKEGHPKKCSMPIYVLNEHVIHP